MQTNLRQVLLDGKDGERVLVIASLGATLEQLLSWVSLKGEAVWFLAIKRKTNVEIKRVAKTFVAI